MIAFNAPYKYENWWFCHKDNPKGSKNWISFFILICVVFKELISSLFNNNTNKNKERNSIFRIEQVVSLIGQDCI